MASSSSPRMSVKISWAGTSSGGSLTNRRSPSTGSVSRARALNRSLVFALATLFWSWARTLALASAPTQASSAAASRRTDQRSTSVIVANWAIARR